MSSFHALTDAIGVSEKAVVFMKRSLHRSTSPAGREGAGGRGAAARLHSLAVALMLLIATACSSRREDFVTGGTEDSTGAGGDGGSEGSSDDGHTDGPSGDEPEDSDAGHPFYGTSVDECGPDNSAELTPEQVAQLLAGGGSADGMRWLYPYDGTVFPRGLKAPLLMWDGPLADAVYVHLHSRTFDYRGCLKPSAGGRVALPQGVWEQLGEFTGGASDPFMLELTSYGEGEVHGPLVEQVVVAQATVSGSIFYNSYNAGTTSMGGGGVGAVMRIKTGQDAERFARLNKCTGCHSVSANGTRLVAREIDILNWFSDGSVYSISPNTAAYPEPFRASTNSGFVGLSPDGSVYVTSGARANVGPLLQGGTAGVGDQNATMFETDSGTVVADTGIATTLLMPTFSPDGTLIAGNDYALFSGHTLVLMDYDETTRKVARARPIYSSEAMFPGWPFVLPDNQAVIFTLGESHLFDGGGAGITTSVARGPKSDLYVVDVKSGAASILARAMGYQTAAEAEVDGTYLPFGAEDLHENYYPTVTPVASGGYFWVFFDSMRNYGNLGRRRQLWGTAIKVSADGSYQSDPSYPPFYVSGQEVDAANHRAFTALDPCLGDGEGCASGVDCCGGFCLDYSCGGPTGGCAGENEACQTDADCCDNDHQCINGFCSVIIL